MVGPLMGLTADWLTHFDKHTKNRKTDVYQLLVLDGHENHHSDTFEQYCKENSIHTLCMPPHSYHILELLDVACFAPLKKAYGAQIEYHKAVVPVRELLCTARGMIHLTFDGWTSCQN